jgi:tRNA(Ile)-lysidine synthase TilS/MesJ
MKDRLNNITEDEIRCEMCLNTFKTKNNSSKIIEYNGKKICMECYYSLKYPRNFKKMKKEIETILKDSQNKKTKGRNNKYDCILAFSGGKDSVVALYLLLKDFNVNPLCITVDNKYMSKDALENCYTITRHLNVDWLVLNRDYTELFKETILRGESPCRRCSELIMREVWRMAKILDIDKIITGHELPFGTSPFKKLKDNIVMVRLLTGYRLTDEDRYNILKELPWKNPNLGGYTTNCLVLAPALREFYKKHGFSFEFNRVCAMVRYGLIDRKKAMEVLRCPDVPKEIYIELKKRGLDLEYD